MPLEIRRLVYKELVAPSGAIVQTQLRDVQVLKHRLHLEILRVNSSIFEEARLFMLQETRCIFPLTNMAIEKMAIGLKWGDLAMLGELNSRDVWEYGMWVGPPMLEVVTTADDLMASEIDLHQSYLVFSIRDLGKLVDALWHSRISWRHPRVYLIPRKLEDHERLPRRLQEMLLVPTWEHFWESYTIEIDHGIDGLKALDEDLELRFEAELAKPRWPTVTELVASLENDLCTAITLQSKGMLDSAVGHHFKPISKYEIARYTVNSLQQTLIDRDLGQSAVRACYTTVFDVFNHAAHWCGMQAWILAKGDPGTMSAAQRASDLKLLCGRCVRVTEKALGIFPECYPFEEADLRFLHAQAIYTGLMYDPDKAADTCDALLRCAALRLLDPNHVDLFEIMKIAFGMTIFPEGAKIKRKGVYPSMVHQTPL